MVVLVPVLASFIIAMFAMTEDFFAGLVCLVLIVVLFWPMFRESFIYMQEQNERRRWRRMRERE